MNIHNAIVVKSNLDIKLGTGFQFCSKILKTAMLILKLLSLVRINRSKIEPSLMWTWGSDIYGRLGHGTEDKNLEFPSEVKVLSALQLKSVACGSAHNIVIDVNGQCYTWGKCHRGQLGHGEVDRDEHVPRPVEALRGVIVDSIGAGDSHVVAVTNEGQVYSWGVGYYGCLGHGDETTLTLPKRIEALSNQFITSASAGAYHSVALTKEGSVYLWGRDNCGQLGQPAKKIAGLIKDIRLNQKIPIVYENQHIDTKYKITSACNNHTLLLLESGAVLSLGFNENGELGRKKAEKDAEDDPIIDPSYFRGQDERIEPVKLVCAGWKHCAAITVSGCLYTWGHGAYGRLGQGHCRNEPNPKQVKEVAGEKSETPHFKDIGCGKTHTVALDEDGIIWACGSGHYGKLGLPIDGSGFISKFHSLSFRVDSLSGVCCGTNHCMAYHIV